MNKKISLIIFLLGSFININAQQKNLDKAKIEFEKKNFKGADKLINKCLLNEETKDNVNVYLLKSKIQFEISKDKSLSSKYPSAFKDALKFADKSLDKCENESQRKAFLTENKLYFTQIIKQNNKEGTEAYDQKKWSKAIPIYKRSLAFGLDTQTLVYMADCYWQQGQKAESLPYFKKSAEIIFNALADSNSKVYGYHKIPFRRLGKYYMDKKQYDTAYGYVKNGFELLPMDDTLAYYNYGLMRYAISNVRPSFDYLNMAKQGVKKFPTDSFFNHKENAIYIFYLNGMAKANDQTQFDSFLNIFAKTKLAKAKNPKIDQIKKYDVFAGQDDKTFYNNFYTYLGDIGLREACFAAFLANNKINPDVLLGASKDPNFNKAENDKFNAKHIVFRKNLKPLYSEIIFDRYLQLDPKNTAHRQGRKDYTANLNKSLYGYYDFLPLIILNDACAKDFPSEIGFKAKAKELRTRLISEAIDSNDFTLARKILNQSNNLYPELKKELDVLFKKIVIQDFKYSYFGSRVNLKGKNEPNVPEYQWSGNIDRDCDEGKMSELFINKASQRINYFRRMAGVSDNIVLTDDNNENCQFAALMCQANNSMSHEPSDAWRCFVPAGLDALKLSILSKDGNPLIAVTAAMGHNHATVGNRRWLLNPYGQLMGIGTASNYTAILAIDNSNKTDTLLYKTKPVAWPPQGYYPKMLLFKKWSFSIDQNMKGAIVSMKNNSGLDIPLKVETIENGYGQNTIVWEPEISAQTVLDNVEYSITVKLSNGKIFIYKVTILDIKP